MEPVLWVQPDEVWPDRQEPDKINYILSGEGFERWKYVRNRPGYAHHDPSCTDSSPNWPITTVPADGAASGLSSQPPRAAS